MESYLFCIKYYGIFMAINLAQAVSLHKLDSSFSG